MSRGQLWEDGFGCQKSQVLWGRRPCSSHCGTSGRFPPLLWVSRPSLGKWEEWASDLPSTAATKEGVSKVAGMTPRFCLQKA